MLIECDPGDNGGIPQHYNALVFGLTKYDLKINITSYVPRFSIDDIDTSDGIKIQIVSVNRMGTSPTVILHADEIKIAEKITG